MAAGLLKAAQAMTLEVAEAATDRVIQWEPDLPSKFARWRIRINEEITLLKTRAARLHRNTDKARSKSWRRRIRNKISMGN